MGQENDQYWMYRWIDEFEIDSRSAFERALNSGEAMARLHELAAEASTDETTLERDPQWSNSTIVAGEGFNLSTETTCISLDCKLNEIDSSITKTWHYFDTVVLAGPSPMQISSGLENLSGEAAHRLHRLVLTNVEILTYLRQIGAAKRVAFKPNNWHIKTPHMWEVAKDMGLNSVADPKLRRALIKQLEHEAKISTSFSRGFWRTRIDHPLILEPTVQFSTVRTKKKAYARSIFTQYSRAAIQDYAKARTLNLPLASNVRAAWLRKGGQSNVGAVDERLGNIALKIELPVMNGLNTRDLLQLLEDQEPARVRFQAALRVAIKENLEKLDSKSDEDIARIIKHDYIEPELQDIRQQLTVANKSFGKKLATGVAIGTLTTSVGLIAAMPLVIAAGLAAGATLIPHAYSHIESKNAIELSDMYFLWNIRKRQHV